MARVIRRSWEGLDVAGLPRRDRMTCDYDAYIPDPLRDRVVLLDGDVAAEVTEAETAVAQLDATGATLLNTETLARLLLRAEAVASSRIEGLEVGGRRLLQAEMERRLDDESGDVTAKEVLGNVDAMVSAIEAVQPGDELELRHILEIHRRLLVGTRLHEHAGHLRQEQNWIGGSRFNPCSADFVPPPHEMVRDLLDDLCSFCNQDSLPTIVQAAIAHAQFETIHPFVDGNGRTGRVLIHVILRRRGLARRALPPVSLILATWSRDYIERLKATRYLGSSDSKQAHDGLNRWIGLFAAACRRAVADATDFELRSETLRRVWKESLGRVRADSALDKLIKVLPGAPIVTVETAADLIDRSFQATNEGIVRLVDAGILAQVTVGRRNRAFEAREAIDAFTDLERQMASPEGNTRISPPRRPIPPRSR